MSNDILYYAVSDVLKKVLGREQSLRNAVYGSTYKNKKSLLRLSCETLRFRSLFDDLLEDSEIGQIPSDPVLNGDLNLLHVLLYEFLIGAGLGRASSRLRGVIYKHAKAIHDRIGRGVAAIKESNEQKGSTLAIPRYARINTLKWTAKEAIETLIDEDWKVVSLSTEDDFVERVGHIAADEVFIDPHIEDLLIFPHSNDFHRYWLVEQRYLILQDKASCLPAYLLSPPLDSHVFDVCAAPGMKTSHVAAILQGTGKIWAIDRSADRMETMERMLEECDVDNVSIFNEDFLRVDVNDRKFAEVRYAVVDPPCSGSGMVKRMDELTGGSAPPERLSKLRNLQAMILKHALKFPNLQRAVYSTCSVYEEENEQVVDEVLSDTYVRQNFRLASRVLPSWKFRGLDTYEFGSDCLRADPAKTLTNGFFVAVFERIVEKSATDMRKIRKTRQYTEGFENAGKTAETRKRKAVEGNSNDKEVSVAEYACPKKKKKKKMKQSEMRSKN